MKATRKTLRRSWSWSGSGPRISVLLRPSLRLWLLPFYEQAKELSVALLKQWLTKYKFKDWTTHRTNNPGSQVTDAEKEQRATEIKELTNSIRIYSDTWSFVYAKEKNVPFAKSAPRKAGDVWTR